jgi:hypothetical protein
MPEFRENVHFDLIAVIAQRRRLQVKRRIPPVNPVHETKLSRARANVCMVAYRRFLITAIVLRSFAGLKSVASAKVVY